MTRLRIVGTIERYDVSIAEWDEAVKSARASLKTGIKLVLQEQHVNKEAWDRGDTDAAAAWDTISEYDGTIENL